MKYFVLIAAPAILSSNTLMVLGSSSSHDEAHFFFVSKIRDDQNWCFAAPDMGFPPKGKGTIEFGLCQQYFDEYRFGRQSWRLDDEGKLLNREYSVDFDYCVVVNDGETIGNGRLHLTECRNDNTSSEEYLNKFAYDSESQNLKLVTSLGDYCVTNSGVNPDVGDRMVVKECGIAGRYRFELKEARRYWQVLADNECPTLCMLSEYPINPTTGDKVKVDHCTSDGSDAWRHESTEEAGSLAVLLHSRQHDSLCLQAGVDATPKVGTAMVLYPCDTSNNLQRLVQEYGNDYYKMSLQYQPELCVSYEGGICAAGDKVVLKNCSEDGVEIWADDEG